MKNNYFYFHSLSIIFFTFLLIPNIIHAQPGSQLNNQLLLKEGHKIVVASYNADGYCTSDGKQTVENRGETNERWRGCPDGERVDWREAMRTYMVSGKKFDIVGFQEIKPLSRSDSDVHYFTNFMKSDYGLEYNCVEAPNSTGNSNAICSLFPILTQSFLTINPERVERSQVDCVQIQTPAGIIVFCNAHPNYQWAVEQFSQMEAWIVDQVIPSYIPSDIPAQQRDAYRKSLYARTILTGDMNASLSQITTQINGKFLSTCPTVESTNMFGIDQVMYFDMKRNELSGGAPFNEFFLVPTPNGCKTVVDKWPTDHLGPVVAEFTTKRLELTASGELAQRKGCALSLARETIPSNAKGRVILEAVSSAFNPEEARIILTTHGSQKITPTPTGTTEIASNNKFFYLLDGKGCQTGNDQICQTATDLPILDTGSYELFCDMPTQPGKCSGNPSCTYNGGTVNCEGWVSCSGKDSVILTVETVPSPSPDLITKPGDVDLDKDVDIFDYTILVGIFGNTGAAGFHASDFDKNGKVDIFDFNILITNFGK